MKKTNEFTELQMAKMDKIKKLNARIPRTFFLAGALSLGLMGGCGVLLYNMAASDAKNAPAKNQKVENKKNAVPGAVMLGIAFLAAMAFLVKAGQGRWNQRCFERAEKLVMPNLTKEEFEEICSDMNLEMMMCLSAMDRAMIDTLVKNDALTGNLDNITIESIVWMIAGHLQSHPDEFNKIMYMLGQKYPQITNDKFYFSRDIARLVNMQKIR